MKEMYPDLVEGSAVYVRLYGEVKVLRRCGQRLDKLVNEFGIGIVGLIPLIRNVTTADQPFEITYQA